MARFTYEDLDKNIKNNTINNNFKQYRKNKFLIKNKTNDEFNFKNNLKLNKKNDIKYKINSYIEKQKSSNNILNNKANEDIINLISDNSNTYVENIYKNNENMNKYYNLIYENKISLLESEINDLQIKKQSMKENIIIFLNSIKNYSYKLSSLIENISDVNYLLNSNEFQEIKLTIFNLNNTLNNPKLNEDFFEMTQFTNFYENEDNKLTKNNTDNETYNKNKSILEEYKNELEKIISKYEKKIGIINREKDEILNQVNILKNENDKLKEQLNEEKKNNENISNDLNKIKEENINLEKQNKILDYKCTSYYNISEKSRYDQKNIEDEIEYKNKIIKYLQDLLRKTSLTMNDDIYKNNFNKIMDLKKNIKYFVKEKKVINNLINKKHFNSLNNLNNHNIKNIENEKSNINDKSDKSISFSNSNSNYNNNQVKQEIGLLDKEIEQIYSKLENLIKNEKY